MADMLELEKALNADVSVGGTDEALRQAAYSMFSATACVTSAFGKVEVELNSNGIVVKVWLRWWARFRLFGLMRFFQRRWLFKARKECLSHAPEGCSVGVIYV